MLVSVVIPSYNHSRFIEEAVRSVLDQTYRAIELIVIDDGSSDNSVELLSKIDDPRMQLHTQSNQGAHYTINRGLGLASGDYVTILNSDDVFTLDRIQRCVRFMDAEDVDLVSTWIEVVDAEGKPQGVKRGWHNMRPRWASSGSAPGFWDHDDFALNLLSSNFPSTTSNLFCKRAVIETCGGMRNLRFSHDWDFFLRAAARYHCKLLDLPLMKYRLHGSNTISSNRKWMLFETCWVLAVNLPAYEGGKLFGPEAPQVTPAEMVELVNNSIKVLGCERLMNVLRMYVQSKAHTEGERAGEDLLEDAALRQRFIDLIEE